MTMSRSTAIIVVSLFFLAIAAWWISYVPHDPDHLYDFIPPRAMVVFESDNFAGRVDRLAESPLVREVFRAAGVQDEKKYRAIVGNHVTRKWIRRIASREVVLAFVPGRDLNSTPALVGAAWIGGESFKFRWLLQMFPGDLMVTRLPHGKVIWSAPVDPKDPAPERFISFSIEEGVALACISADPLGVLMMLDRLEQPRGIHAELVGGRLSRAERLWPRRTSERGWISLSPPWSYRLPEFTAFTIEQHSATNFSATLTCAGPIQGTAVDGAEREWDVLAALLGPAPVIAAYAPVSAWQNIAGLSGLPEKTVRVFTTLVNAGGEPAERPGALFLLGDEYSGRLKGPLKGVIPAFLSGFKVPVAVAAASLDQAAYDFHDQRLLQALDHLNALNGWALIPHKVTVGETSMTLVEESRADKFYNKFAPDERVACAVVGRWLVVASHAGRLKTMLGQYVAATNTVAGGFAWGPAAHTVGGGLIDISGVQQIVRNLLGMAQLATMFGDPDKTARSQKQIELARTVVEAFNGIRLVHWQVAGSAPARLVCKLETRPVPVSGN